MREDGVLPGNLLHADTLGAVSGDKAKRQAQTAQIGGFAWGAFEGENLLVRTARGGGRLPASGEGLAARLFRRGQETPRNDDTVEVRLDEPVRRQRMSGPWREVGDFVFFDPRYETTGSGFIKSRFLDDKACVAFMFAAIKALRDGGTEPDRTAHFYLTNCEEVGHGISFMPEDAGEHVALDIGIVAPGTNSREDAVTIVARDSRTPYDFASGSACAALRRRKISHRVDTHFRYGSDAGVAAVAASTSTLRASGP